MSLIQLQIEIYCDFHLEGFSLPCFPDIPDNRLLAILVLQENHFWNAVPFVNEHNLSTVGVSRPYHYNL